MAMLKTPYHQCETVIVNSDHVPIGKCARPAYRRVGGRWLCKVCGQRAKRRMAA